MITAEEALQKIFANTPKLPSERAPLAEAVERVLAEDLVARQDLPSFDNAAMDGYAVKLADGAAVFRVRDVVRAGAPAGAPLAPGEAVKIMTGAPVPEGTDAVVMRELTETAEGGRVRVLQAPKPGENLRRRGEDVRAGDPLLQKGALIRPYEVGLLASQGFSTIPVIRRPRVSVLSTGDELVAVERTPGPGQIRGSNGPALAAAVGRWGAEVATHPPLPDDPALLRAAFASALERSDVLLVSGGVSVGDFDHTKKLLEELGLRTVFWKAAIKPGKPLLFGRMGEKIVFGLPGNPVAALICAEEFVRPALEKMGGHRPVHPSYHLEGVVENDYPKDEKRQQYVFCRAAEFPDGFRLHIIRPQGSAMMGMAVRANALALGPIGVSRMAKGMRVKFRWLK